MTPLLQDITSSVLAFLGLGSLVLCYLNYALRKLDYVAFMVVFFILGWYTAITPEMLKIGNYHYQWIIATSFAIGVLPILWLKMYRLKKSTLPPNKHHQKP